MLRNFEIKVAVFADFDGTLTGRDGGKTVSDPFYKSLYKNPELVFDSPEARMKDEKTVSALFRTKFGEYKPDAYTKPDADLLITKNAVDFLHTMLENPEITVNIISKNRQEYIVALLKYHGFTPEEIARLTIKPLTLKDKSKKVMEICVDKLLTDIKPTVYLFDDVQVELNQMSNAVRLTAATQSPINFHHHNPGEFPWETYTQKIERHTKKSSIEEKKNEQPVDKLVAQSPKEETHFMENLSLFPPKKEKTDGTVSPATSASQSKLKPSE